MLFIPAISFALTPLPPLFGTTQTSDTPHLPHARATSGASEHAFVGEVAPPQAPSNSLVEFAMHLDSPRMARVGAGSHLGTPRDLVGGDGTVRWSAAYTAWGKVYEEFVADAQGPRGPPNAVQSPFRLLGQYYDEETGLSATRFRMWDAETGRWCSTDPLGIIGGENLCGFDGAPTFDSDPLGLATCKKKAKSVPPKGALQVLARKISDAANHFLAKVLRVVAVGRDKKGRLFVASSNGLDEGQRAEAKKLGITVVPSLPDHHAEESLMAQVPNLEAVGTWKRDPCGPTEHNCAQQLTDAGIIVDNE